MRGLILETLFYSHDALISQDAEIEMTFRDTYWHLPSSDTYVSILLMPRDKGEDNDGFKYHVQTIPVNGASGQ